MIIDQDLEKYYNSYLELFMTDGWKQFKEDTENVIKSINLLALEDAKQLHLAQGQMEILNWILDWETSVKNSYETLQSETISTEGQENFQ
jgi:hypothetical protein|tara:strand:+ start:407 stop:676 length:270 start_codon:yes stop_codon:yes gene_type:complete